MEINFRCNCPITSALDVLGDKWILVIIKLILMEEKRTFKDLVESDESIATNILTSKLKFLEEVHLITKHNLENNKKVKIYKLTDKALALTPIIVELASWSDDYLRDLNPNIIDGDAIKLLRTDKSKFSKFLIDKYKKQNI